MESIEKQFSKSVKERLAIFDKELDKLLNQTGIKMVKEVRTLQDVNQNYASRELSNKTNYLIQGTTLTLGSNATSPTGYNYGLVQEFGRKPGKWPNFEAIYDWVDKKVKLGHMSLSEDLGKDYNHRVGQLAFLISAKIKAKGIKGKFFYKKAFEIGEEFLISKLVNVITDVFK